MRSLLLLFLALNFSSAWATDHFSYLRCLYEMTDSGWRLHDVDGIYSPVALPENQTHLSQEWSQDAEPIDVGYCTIATGTKTEAVDLVTYTFAGRGFEIEEDCSLKGGQNVTLGKAYAQIAPGTVTTVEINDPATHAPVWRFDYDYLNPRAEAADDLSQMTDDQIENVCLQRFGGSPMPKRLNSRSKSRPTWLDDFRNRNRENSAHLTEQ
jgi:hypothetical protein